MLVSNSSFPRKRGTQWPQGQSTFSSARKKGRWTPDQVRGDGFILAPPYFALSTRREHVAIVLAHVALGEFLRRPEINDVERLARLDIVDAAADLRELLAGRRGRRGIVVGHRQRDQAPRAVGRQLEQGRRAARIALPVAGAVDGEDRQVAEAA